MKVWAHLFNACIYESAPAVQSLHMTKEGAEKAMQDAKDLEYASWQENMRYYSDPANGLEEYLEQEYRPKGYQEHSIEEMEVYE